MNSRRLARAMEAERTLADGEYVFRRHDVGGEMFVVRSGCVVLSRIVGGREVEIERLTRGAFFGEMSVLESLPREADARAVGPTTLLVIGSGGLLLRLRRDPSFALEMLHRMSGRIRVLNTRFEDTTPPDGST